MLLFLCVFLLYSCLIEYSLSLNIPNSSNNLHVFRYDYKYNDEIDGFFKLHDVAANWREAHDRCHLEGAELATPIDIPMLNAIISKMRGNQSLFTGIHSIFSHGDFYSIKGIPLKRLPVTWAPYAPSGDQDKRCAVLHQNGTITNDACDAYYSYICYKKNDHKPMTECGTIDTEYIFIDQSNACYKFHARHKSWLEAYRTCSGEGGHLMVVNNKKDLKALHVLVQQYPQSSIMRKGINNIFVGITYMFQAEYWVTILGERLDETKFSIWGPEEPTNVDYLEYCGALTDLAILNDVSCDSKLPFICKKELDSLLSNSNDT